MNNKHICKVPFSEVEIHISGEVYVCCPSKNNFSIGNIYKNSFDEIWYSERAKELRQDILNNQYTQCNLDICNPADNIEQDKLELTQEEVNLSLTPPYPKYVKFCHDYSCNIKCITCRDIFYMNSKEKTEELNSYIENIYLPILKNCEVVSLNGTGEVFASPHCKTLVKKISEKYPNIKFDFHTNGVLCTEKLCYELGITDKICSVSISMSAATPKTYNKIMLYSNYDKVIENIKWLNTLLKKGTLKNLDLYFVVQKLNYQEMIPFIKFAKSVNASVYFWELRKWSSNFCKDYDKYAIHEKTHREYNKFAKILQDPIFKDKNVHLNNLLENIKPISFREKLKLNFSNNKFLNYFTKK